MNSSLLNCTKGNGAPMMATGPERRVMTPMKRARTSP